MTSHYSDEMSKRQLRRSITRCFARHQRSIKSMFMPPSG